MDQETPVGLRKRSRRRAPLSTNEKLDISFRAIKIGENLRELANEFNVTNARISQIVKKAREAPKLMAELLSKNWQSA